MQWLLGSCTVSTSFSAGDWELSPFLSPSGRVWFELLGCLWLGPWDWAECIPVTPCCTQVPQHDLGRSSRAEQSCVTVVFYDHYLDKSQFHCGVMLIIVSAKLDLLSLPPAPPFPIDLKLSLMILCWVTFPCFLGRGRLCLKWGKCACRSLFSCTCL